MKEGSFPHVIVIDAITTVVVFQYGSSDLNVRKIRIFVRNMIHLVRNTQVLGNLVRRICVYFVSRHCDIAIIPKPLLKSPRTGQCGLTVHTACQRNGKDAVFFRIAGQGIVQGLRHIGQ